MNKEISKIEQSISPLIDRAKDIVISTTDDMLVATGLLSDMNRIMDRVEAEKEKVMRPLLDATAAERARWKPIETAYKAAIDPLRKKISEYQTEATRKQQEEAARLANDIAKGTKTLDEAANALATVSRPQDRVDTPSGSLTFKEQKICRITDATKVPAKYWIIDVDAVFDALKEGLEVKGACIEVIQVPINRR